MIRLAGDWGLSLLSPMFQGPCIGNGMMSLAEMNVLAAKPQVLQWHKAVVSNGGMCQQVHIVVVNPLHPVACLGHLKGGMHLPGKLLAVFVTRDHCELPHQDSICTCLTCHSIQSEACKGEHSRSSGIDGGGGDVNIGGRPPHASAPAREGSSPLSSF